MKTTKTRHKTLKNKLLKFYKCEIKQFNKISGEE